MAKQFALLAKVLARCGSWKKLRHPRVLPPGELVLRGEPAFDEVAKALAAGLPRREVLRHLGVGLTSALLASLGLERAWGHPLDCVRLCGCYRGRAWLQCLRACRQAQCAFFCSHFRPQQAVLRCLRDAAAGIGLCEACDADPRRLCRTASGALICCDRPNICHNGECRSQSQACGKKGGVCPPDYLCVAVGRCCPRDTPVLCDDGFCYPAGTRCCGPARPPCPKGEQCCHGICISDDATCCPVEGFCPKHLPVCFGGSGGICCPTDPRELCLGHTFQKTPALDV